MKPFAVYGAVGLGGISAAATVGYSVRTILGLGGSSTSLALDILRDHSGALHLLLLGAGLLALALWRQRLSLVAFFR